MIYYPHVSYRLWCTVVPPKTFSVTPPGLKKFLGVPQPGGNPREENMQTLHNKTCHLLFILVYFAYFSSHFKFKKGRSSLQTQNYHQTVFPSAVLQYVSVLQLIVLVFYDQQLHSLTSSLINLVFT